MTGAGGAAAGRRRSFAAWALCLAAALGGCGDDSAVPEAPPAGERLMAAAPPEFERTGSSISDGLRVTEFLRPAGPDADTVEALRFESSRSDPLPDPLDSLDALAAEQRTRCPSLEHYSTFAGEENGYPTAVRLYLCKEDEETGRASVTLTKAIQGNDWFYLISRQRNAPPPPSGLDLMSPDDMAAWSLYMRTVTVCDPSNDAHPCPEDPSSPDPPA